MPGTGRGVCRRRFTPNGCSGRLRDNAPLQVVCERDAASGAILARNAWAGDFSGRLAFAAAGPRLRSATADRTEFLGRNGSPSAPAAFGRIDLSGCAGPALDPCAALMTEIVLAPGQADEVVFVLGQAESLERVRRLIAAYTDPGRAREVLVEVQRLWDRILGAVQVATPDAASTCCSTAGCSTRCWPAGSGAGRRSTSPAAPTASATSSRTSWPWSTAAPKTARAQILRSAARQFEEGDVQHWWHPPAGRGVRTRISDDFLWLPLVVHHYVTTTGDAALLDEPVPFLQVPGAAARPGRGLRLAGRERANGHGVRPLRARPGARLPARAARPAADGHRRLERRHEPGRRRRQGRKRLERLVLRDRAEGVRRPGRAARRQPAGGVVPGTSRGAAGGAGGARLGRRAGIAGPISTTARRWARPKTTSARSTRSPRPGR